MNQTITMDKKIFQQKVVETAFWVAISPVMSLFFVGVSVVLGVKEGGCFFVEQATEYYKTIERIWTN